MTKMQNRISDEMSNGVAHILMTYADGYMHGRHKRKALDCPMKDAPVVSVRAWRVGYAQAKRGDRLPSTSPGSVRRMIARSTRSCRIESVRHAMTDKPTGRFRLSDARRADRPWAWVGAFRSILEDAGRSAGHRGCVRGRHVRGGNGSVRKRGWGRVSGWTIELKRSFGKGISQLTDVFQFQFSRRNFSAKEIPSSSVAFPFQIK